MAIRVFPWLRSPWSESRWLWGLSLLGIAVLHLSLTSRLSQGQVLLTQGVLVWLAVFYHLLSLTSPGPLEPGVQLAQRARGWGQSRGCRGWGLLPLVLVLVRCWSLPNANFLAVMPGLAGLGLAWLAGGPRGIQTYGRSLLMLASYALLGVVTGVVPTQLAGYTAQVAALWLGLIGLPVRLQGTVLALPGGSVDVNEGCSGAEGMLQLLGIAIIFCTLFPVGRQRAGLAIALAGAIAFVVNSLRVCGLLLCVVYQNRSGFDYWHTGAGSLLFSLVSMGLFGYGYTTWLQPAGNSLGPQTDGSNDGSNTGGQAR